MSELTPDDLMRLRQRDLTQSEKQIFSEWEKLIPICKTCHNMRSCPNVTICCGGRVDVVIQVPCPLGRF